jgi:hypothetical protein
VTQEQIVARIAAIDAALARFALKVAKIGQETDRILHPPSPPPRLGSEIATLMRPGAIAPMRSRR